MKTSNQATNSELIIMAPMQIKPHLSVGNIYDLTIIDFYSKARRFAGVKTTLPFLLNINGKPLINQLEKFGIESAPANINTFIDTSIKTIESELREYYLDFDFMIRDDLILKELEDLASKKYKTTFLVGTVLVNECLSCQNIFGSDPSISVCKICGSKTTIQKRKTLFKKIKQSDIKSKIDSINFFPSSTKIELEGFVSKLPDEYNLILEKKRKNTLEYKEFKLDPRFIAIMLPAVLNASNYRKRVWIHGDVIKKFDYYSLCYLNEEDCPTHIVSHGVLWGINKQKLRWQNSDNTLSLLNGIDKKIIRAYFLRFNIARDRIFNPQKILQDTNVLVKLYVKIGRTLEARNLDRNRQGIRKELVDQMQLFNKFIQKFNFRDASSAMTGYVNMCWKLVKYNKMSIEEQNVLRELKIMYFGN
jgi:hypothetical protein